MSKETEEPRVRPTAAFWLLGGGLFASIVTFGYVKFRPGADPQTLDEYLGSSGRRDRIEQMVENIGTQLVAACHVGQASCTPSDELTGFEVHMGGYTFEVTQPGTTPVGPDNPTYLGVSVTFDQATRLREGYHVGASLYAGNGVNTYITSRSYFTDRTHGSTYDTVTEIADYLGGDDKGVAIRERSHADPNTPGASTELLTTVSDAQRFDGDALVVSERFLRLALEASGAIPTTAVTANGSLPGQP